MAKISVKN